MSESAIELAINKAIDERIRPLEQEIAELKSRVPDHPWDIRQVADELGCSVSTARRRKKDDPKFPAPLKKTKYKHAGRTRLTHDKWDPAEIRRYRSYLNLEANSSAVGL